jgi:ABC-type phosphate transport system substrate-binding protein
MRIRTILLCAAIALAAPAAADETFKVVVNPSNGVSSMTRQQLSQLFLKKSTRWPGGQTVQAVEPSDERLRSAFCKDVHRKTLNAVRSYWNQLIFSGREVPPLEKSDDDAVVSFVRSTPGAIGFVSVGAATPGVKVVAVRD